MRNFFAFLFLVCFVGVPAFARPAGNDDNDNNNNDSRTRAEKALDRMRDNARNNPTLESLKSLRKELRQKLTDLYSQHWQPGANTLDAARERNQVRNEIRDV